MNTIPTQLKRNGGISNTGLSLTQRLCLVAVCLLSCLATGILPTSAAPFENGSFESLPPGFNGNMHTFFSSTGWSFEDIDWVASNGAEWPAEDGYYSLDLNGTIHGRVFQTFDTIIGQEYSVSFWTAGNWDGAVDVPRSFNVTINDTVVSQYSLTYPGSLWTGWTQESLSFEAQQSATTLSFVSTTYGTDVFGPVLDNVSVTLIPEPSSLALVFLGVFCCRGFSPARRQPRHGANPSPAFSPPADAAAE